VGTNGLSELLKRSRLERGESLRTTAKNLGVDPSFLSRVESGERRPSDGLQKQLGEYYGITEDAVTLAIGGVPADVIEILQQRPHLVERLRADYGQHQ